jgi:superfamily I DNA/RNA helicase
MVLLHVDGHDEAYRWAAERRVSRNPDTGDIQVLATVESVTEAIKDVPHVEPQAPPLFDKYDDPYLLKLGVPADWLPAIRQVHNADQLLDAATRYPEAGDVWDRLLRLANGDVVVPAIEKPVQPAVGDATGRPSWVVDELEELEQAKSQPWQEWERYLHPAQLELVQNEYNGPVKVTGAAGTGKTVVAIHRAAFLAHKGKKVLLTSFVTTLCHHLRTQLESLCPKDVLCNVTVLNIHRLALRLVREAGVEIEPADDTEIDKLIGEFAQVGGGFSSEFLKSEWKGVIRAQGILTAEEYMASQRTGRGSSLSAEQRRRVWEVFARILEELRNKGKVPYALVCRQAREFLEAGRIVSPFDAVIADEAQDLGQQEIRLLAALTAANPAGLMLVGDAGQRIYPGGYSLKALGINVSGRSKRLRVVYRTSEEIRRFAARISADSRDDLDGGSESSSDSFSLAKGTPPTLQGFATPEQQAAYIAKTLASLRDRGIADHEVGIFVRSNKLANELISLLSKEGVRAIRLGDAEEGVSVGTMHRAKGLEFRAVIIAYCQHGQIPNYAAIREADVADQDAVRSLERQLLYVSATRARDELIVTWVGKPSEFLRPVLSGGSAIEA